MKKAGIPFTVLLAGFVSALVLVQACRRDAETDGITPVHPAADMVAYYVNLIAEHQKTGNSVFFRQRDGSMVENPDKAWLEQAFAFPIDPAVPHDRSISSYYTWHFQIISGAVKNLDLHITGATPSSLWGLYASTNPSCYTAGNTYAWGVWELITTPTECPSMGVASGTAAGCHLPGTAKVTVTRSTGPGCYCSNYIEKTFNIPNASVVRITSASGFCCGTSTCD